MPLWKPTSWRAWITCLPTALCGRPLATVPASTTVRARKRRRCANAHPGNHAHARNASRSATLWRLLRARDMVHQSRSTRALPCSRSRFAPVVSRSVAPRIQPPVSVASHSSVTTAQWTRQSTIAAWHAQSITNPHEHETEDQHRGNPRGPCLDVCHGRHRSRSRYRSLECP